MYGLEQSVGTTQVAVYRHSVVKAFLICLLAYVLEKGCLCVEILYSFLISHQFKSIKITAEFPEKFLLDGRGGLEMV